ncbi:MAG: hypothetical protein RIB84_23830 [Sneathiellaceae bacterium]
MTDSLGWDVPPAEGAGDEGDCPVTALGHAAGRYWFLTPDGELRALAPRAMNGVEILALFAGDDTWMKAWFPAKGPGERYAWSLAGVQGWMLRACHAAGPFHADREVRGPGVWPVPAREGGGLIVHCGDALYRAGPEAGGALQPLGRAGVRLGRHIYPTAPAETPPAERPADAAEAAAVLEVLDMWSWRAPTHAAKLLLGWVCAGGVAGALNWRPHVLVTGGQGSGKSTLLRLLRDDLLGSTAVGMSDSTEAGIRQALQGAARPVFLDEIENDNPERARAVVRLARLASTEGQGLVYRGSADGKASAWPIRSSFLFSAIVFGRLRPQDANRIAILELDSLPVGLSNDVTPRQALLEALEGIEGAGPRLRRRMLDGWARFQANLAALEHAVVRSGAAERVGDQLGTLLAAAETVLRDEALSIDQAAELVADYVGEPDIVGYADDSDQADALQHLLTSSVMVHWPGEGSSVETVGEAIKEHWHRECAKKALRNHGLAVVEQGGGMWLAVANSHSGLARLFVGTPWQDAWRTPLRRVHGAVSAPDKISFGGVKARATLLPWLEVFDEAAPKERAGAVRI